MPDGPTGTCGRADRIFVSIPSYRDPQLVPTVRDCLAKASHPERLTFAICWQHADDEQLPESFRGDQFRLLDVDWRGSRGACWARAKVMDLWDGEEWYLQLDSHHRFVPDWDVALLDEAARTGSDRPVLTAYPPPFSPDQPIPTERIPMSIQYKGFRPDGLPSFSPSPIADWEQRTRPHRSRFVSAAFLFAPGSFVRDVPYDPELYFDGEEITLAVRAFTHGYDLFEPSRTIVWHQYMRSDQRKHWDDHTGDDGPAWHALNDVSLRKIRQLFDAPSVGRFGLGVERTLLEYESYAGISFHHRQVQDYTRRNLEPPNPPASPDWPTQVHDHDIHIAVEPAQLPPGAFDDPEFWYVGVHDADGVELYRHDIKGEELPAVNGSQFMTTAQFASQAHPATWTVMPYSKIRGWLPAVTGAIHGLTPVGQENKSTPKSTEPRASSASARDGDSAAIRLARRLENDDKLAEHAYRMAAEEDDNPEARYWLGSLYVKQQNYEKARDELQRAMDSGHVKAAYLLGRLAPYDEYLVPEDLAASIAEALPDRAEFWQAHLTDILKKTGKDGVRTAIDNAIKQHSDYAILRLLRIRLDSPHYPTYESLLSEGLASLWSAHYPENMHPELHFHTAVRLIFGDCATSLPDAISKARGADSPPWLSQLLAIEAAYNYRTGVGHINSVFHKVAELLEAALALKPCLAKPLSYGDVQYLVLILKSAGNEAAQPLRSQLIRAQPIFEHALSHSFDGPTGRKPVFDAVISSMVRGIDISAPIPDRPALGVDETHESVDSAGACRETGTH
jgi:hypothetical protein